MSFMFHPYPFKDPRAVNPVEADEETLRELTTGARDLARRLLSAVERGARTIGVDGYAGAPLEALENAFAQQLGGEKTLILNARRLWRGAAEIRDIIAPSLPMDREIDPPLLYGVRIERRYEQLFDTGELAALKETLQNPPGVVLVIGQGSLCETLLPHYDLRIWTDITPMQAALNFKHNRARNLGEPRALPYAEMMRRNYYVDFELAIERRWALIRSGAIDWYVSADDPENLVMLPFDRLCHLFDALRQRPLRCRPVYLEGVWGGYYMKRLRGLPAEMRNCAWVFDMIPMEVSLVAMIGGREFEVPFFTFVQQQAEKLLGREVFEAFGGYFPIRFNYDDTFHSSGNMSIQCHPDEAYVVGQHGELGRQDESYYVCVAGDGARTYLGFENEASCAGFLDAAQKSVEDGGAVDYEKYIHAVPSKVGTQFMIPAGTVHASGHNQLILEIGSLTVGSYTYKLYDYLRADPQTGQKRPIHLEAGRRVLRPERTKKWVDENLVNRGSVVRAGESGTETVVGEHEQMYFSLRTLRFDTSMNDDTRGQFHVLTLTEGENVRIESRSDPGRFFAANYLDVVVVPADFGAYRLVNGGQGAVTVHKTTVKGGTLHA